MAFFLPKKSRTLLRVIVARSIPWTKPEDFNYNAESDLDRLQLFDAKPFRLLKVDGAALVLKQPIDRKLFHKLATKGGGEMIDQNELDQAK